MELTYRLTREDHQHFCQLAVARVTEHAQRVSGLRASPTLVSVGALLLTIFALAYLVSLRLLNEFEWVVAVAAYIWGVLSMQLCAWYWQRLYWRNVVADDSPFLSEVRLKLDGDGIEAAGPNAAKRYNWKAIKEVSESRDVVILWLDRAQGIVVSEQAFPNQDARQRFVGVVREQVAASA